MQFSMIAAVAALAVSVSAISNGTVAYITETLTEFTTVCPAATTLTYNGVTITATESEVVTLPCPCTVVKPVTTTSSVICSTCTEAVPTSTPVYSNGTIATTAPATTKGSVGTTSVKTSAVKTSSVATSTTSSVTTAFTGGANKFAASGASLAGLVGLAAYIL